MKRTSTRLPSDPELMHKYGDKVVLPVDFAVEQDGERVEIPWTEAVNTDAPVMDIGVETLQMFKDEIASAKTVIANGPPGVFEKEMFALSTND